MSHPITHSSGVLMSLVATPTPDPSGALLVELPRVTLGLDLGDRRTDICRIDLAGNVQERFKVSTERDALEQLFQLEEPSRVVIEVGTHSPWISRLAQANGHEVIIANPRKVKLITQGSRKNDRKDAELLARLGRLDPDLLSPIRHRGRDTQVRLLSIRQRGHLVGLRTSSINHVRGLVKSHGQRVRPCSSPAFAKRAMEDLTPELFTSLKPSLTAISGFTKLIRDLDRQIATPPDDLRDVVERMRQITGVGPLLALTFVLTIEDPHRFEKKSDIGAYLGLVPRQSQSGNTDKQLGITKTGDGYLRALLVNAAHYILSRGPDTRLRRFGEHLEQRAGHAARKRAAVAVARKLAIVLHRLWVTGDDYKP